MASWQAVPYVFIACSAIAVFPLGIDATRPQKYVEKTGATSAVPHDGHSKDEKLVRYLPKTINGIPVIIHTTGSFYRADNAQLQSSARAIAYRRSKNHADKDSGQGGLPWGSIVEGADENDGWLRVLMQVSKDKSPMGIERPLGQLGLGQISDGDPPTAAEEKRRQREMAMLRAEAEKDRAMAEQSAEKLNALGKEIAMLRDKAEKNRHTAVQNAEKVKELEAERDRLLSDKASADQEAKPNEEKLRALEEENKRLLSEKDATDAAKGKLEAERERLLSDKAAADKVAEQNAEKLKALEEENKRLLSEKGAADATKERELAVLRAEAEKDRHFAATSGERATALADEVKQLKTALAEKVSSPCGKNASTQMKGPANATLAALNVHVNGTGPQQFDTFQVDVNAHVTS